MICLIAACIFGVIGVLAIIGNVLCFIYLLKLCSSNKNE